jgi:hypothetical protein
MPPIAAALRIATRAGTSQRLSTAEGAEPSRKTGRRVRVGRVKSSRHTLAACAFGLALLAPAIPLAAQEAEQPAADASPPTLTPGNVRPDAALSSSEHDGTVAFDASKSADSDGRVVAFEWDLDGDSVYETETAGEPRVERSYAPGTTLIAAVRVTDDAGASDDATAAVVVAAAPEPAQPAEPAAAPAPADGMSDKLAQLTQLGELKAQGVLTDVEFEMQKRRILG